MTTFDVEARILALLFITESLSSSEIALEIGQPSELVNYVARGLFKAQKITTDEPEMGQLPRWRVNYHGLGKTA